MVGLATFKAQAKGFGFHQRSFGTTASEADTYQYQYPSFCLCHHITGLSVLVPLLLKVLLSLCLLLAASCRRFYTTPEDLADGMSAPKSHSANTNQSLEKIPSTELNPKVYENMRRTPNDYKPNWSSRRILFSSCG